MRPIAAALKGLPAASDSIEASALRIHEERRLPTEVPGAGSLAADDPRALEVWARLLDEFLDAGAARRLGNYAACHAGHRWKPRLALVLPEGFSLRRRSHLRDLAAALEVLASVITHYSIDVVSDSHDAARLFRRVSPFSHKAIAGTSGALVLLSRSLNDVVGAIRPSRYVAADPCADRSNQRRIAFTAAGVEVSSRPADEQEILRTLGTRASVVLDEDDGVGSFIGALRRLRAAGLAMRLALSSRADEEFARWVRAAFGDDDAGVEFRQPASGAFADRAEFHISNEPIALLTQPPSAPPAYYFRAGRFWVVDRERSHRSDYYLLRGEESDAHRLLDAWLVRGAADARHGTGLHPAGSTEPLVSIVVPVHRGTTEILRLACSIYEQDYPWIEVIWVCTGCAPETMEAIRASENYLMKRRYRVRIIELACGAGSAALARDFGVRAASGELACLLDSRDTLGPGFFAFLERGPWREETLYDPARVEQDCGGATAGEPHRVEAIDGPRTLEPVQLVSALRRGDFRGGSGVVFARSLFERAGGIDHRLRGGDVLDLWWRAAGDGTRAEGHHGRVHIPVERQDIGRLPGRVHQIERALEPARGRESSQCP
jgi:hypothetical protein